MAGRTELDEVQRGRESYAKRSWSEAHEALSSADRVTGVKPADLELLATPALHARSRYVALQRLIDADYPAGLRNYRTGDFLTGLPDEAIEIMCRHHLSVPSPLTQILTLPGGGAAARVPDGRMAIGERQAPFNLHITSLWPDPADDAANIAWTRELSAAMKPFTTGRVYVNSIGDEGQERVVASFGTGGYSRLQALKARYDPEDLFRGCRNIQPGA